MMGGLGAVEAPSETMTNALSKRAERRNEMLSEERSDEFHFIPAPRTEIIRHCFCRLEFLVLFAQAKSTRKKPILLGMAMPHQTSQTKIRASA
jgi:hypothetical protein